MNSSSRLREITGQYSYPYQAPLATSGDLSDLLSIPTGAGKTAAIVLGSSKGASATQARPSPRLRVDAPNFVRLVLDGPVRPHVERSLWIGERLRAALLSHVGDRPCAVFTGKDTDGRPLQNHGHAYFLPQANARGEVDHVLVHARDGFDALALHALRSLRVVHGLTSQPVYTTILALGRSEAFEHPPPTLRAAPCWESLTPFVPPRCPKQRRGEWQDVPEAQLRRLCHLVLGVEPTAIHAFTPDESRTRRLHAYRRERRRGGPVPGHAASLGFHLEFAAPVRGPIALGYGAHFGLGQFTPLV